MIREKTPDFFVDRLVRGKGILVSLNAGPARKNIGIGEMSTLKKKQNTD